MEPAGEQGLDGDTLARVLELLAAETRADDAAASRRRTAWLARQAEEEATLAGVLADLADRDRAVVIHSLSGRIHRGWIRAVGRDFLALGGSNGADTLIRTDAVASVRGQQGDDVATGDRTLIVDATLAAMLGSLGPLRPRVLVVTGAAVEPVVGELRFVGADVAALRLDGGGAPAYVPLGAITELTTHDKLVG